MWAVSEVRTLLVNRAFQIDKTGSTEGEIHPTLQKPVNRVRFNRNPCTVS